MIKLIMMSTLLLLSSTSQARMLHSKESPLLVGAKSSKKTLSTEDNYNLTLKKSALEHLFLMKTAMIDNPPAPTGNPMGSKVIFFKKNGPFIGMFETTTGKVVTDSLSTQILLAKFPIISESEDLITFNYEEGMKTLFLKGSYYIARPGSDPTEESSYRVLESFLNRVELVGKHIFIEQFLRVESPAQGKEPASISPIHIKYDFSTYVPNEGFTPTLSPGFTNVGYFENHPTYSTDANGEIVETPVTYVKKFDISKPITFYTTDNTPKKWEKAVQDGVLYWNKAFGKEVIKVATLPSTASIFEPGYNIVQWLDWDTAGFAYAASSSDPLTGEIQNAHVFMTSSFAIGSYKSAKTYLSRLEKEDITPRKLGLLGFTSALNCNDGTDRASADKQRLENFIGEVEGKSFTDEQKEEMYTRYVADYIRQVVAHEVGHTLGFRHNFAASLETSIDSKNYDSISLKYLTTGIIDSDVVPGSSVMDYTPGFFSSFAGAKIRLEEDALLYDQHVVNVSYKGANPYSELLFCTDDHAEKFYDCFRFDAFKNVLEEKKYNYERSLKNIVHILLNGHFSFINDTTLTEEQKLEKFDSVFVNGFSDGLYMANNRFKELVTRAAKGSQSITGNLTALKDDFDAIGGMSKVLFEDITPTLKDGVLISNNSRKFISSFKAIIPSYFGENLTTKIAEKLEGVASKYAQEMEPAFLLTTVPLLTQEYEYRDASFVDSISNLSKVILRTKSTEVDSVEGIKAPLFSLKVGDKSLRGLTSSFINFDFFPESYSFKRSIKRLKHELSKDILSLKEEITLIYGDIDSVPDNVYDFYMTEELEVYNF